MPLPAPGRIALLFLGAFALDGGSAPRRAGVAARTISSYLARGE